MIFYLFRCSGIDSCFLSNYDVPMSWWKLKGKFIVLDGPDGSGKSTQVRLLGEFLQGRRVPVHTVRDPGGTKIGDQIRGILLNTANTEMSVRCEALLYMASRAQLYHEKISPALEEKRCVISDRWLSSTYAYQAVAGRIGKDWLLELSHHALERSWPDLTIIIDLPSKMGLERIGKKGGRKKIEEEKNQKSFDFYYKPDRMESKSLKYHNNVRKAFLKLASSRESFYVIDGTGAIEQVHRRICEVLEKYVDS